MVWILAKMGNSHDALLLMIEKVGDVKQVRIFDWPQCFFFFELPDAFSFVRIKGH